MPQCTTDTLAISVWLRSTGPSTWKETATSLMLWHISTVGTVHLDDCPHQANLSIKFLVRSTIK